MPSLNFGFCDDLLRLIPRSPALGWPGASLGQDPVFVISQKFLDRPSLLADLAPPDTLLRIDGSAPGVVPVVRAMKPPLNRCRVFVLEKRGKLLSLSL
jgi:hypothetical protein